MISSLLLRTSILILLAGILLGIYMGIAHDFQLAPAHAHLNLVGGVLMFLAGLYYRVFPAAARTIPAKMHAGLHVVGGIAFPVGVAALMVGGPQFLPLAIGGSLIVLAGIAMFAFVILTTSGATAFVPVRADAEPAGRRALQMRARA